MGRKVIGSNSGRTRSVFEMMRDLDRMINDFLARMFIQEQIAKMVKLVGRKFPTTINQPFTVIDFRSERVLPMLYFAKRYSYL